MIGAGLIEGFLPFFYTTTSSRNARSNFGRYPVTESTSSNLAVEMRGIVKRFPGVLANDHVDFELRAGEIHALLGENGAGKSTLMNILAGLYKQDAGLIKVNGKPVDFSSPRDAIQSGIGMVHQH